MVSCLGMGVGTRVGSESPMPQRERQRQLLTHSPPDCCSPDLPGCPGNEQSCAEPDKGGVAYEEVNYHMYAFQTSQLLAIAKVFTLQMGTTVQNT